MANDNNNQSGSNGGKRKSSFPGFDLGGGGSSGSPRNRMSFSLLYIVGAVILVILLQSLLFQGPPPTPLTKFYNDVKAERVEEVVLTASSIEWTVSGGDKFTATLPTNFDPTQLTADLAEQGIPVRAEQPSALLGFLFQWVIPILFFVAIWFFLMRRVAGGGAAAALNLGKNRVKIYDRKEMKTTFKDVAGVDEAVEELQEIVEFLRTPKKYQRLGGRIPKGVLLVGPPGCGKTLLARAVAGEAEVPFFYMSGSEFVEMFVGLGAARVRELFQQAKEKAPCLVFLDELDTIGKSRAGGMGGSLGSHDEREQTLNQLLVEMDGFDTSKGVIIMAATNRSDVLDAALLRPGRFDRQVVVDWPDLKGREAILKIHARGVALDPTVELRVLAARTPGFTGADLANVVNEAALLAARREKNSVTMDELEEAIDRVVAGLERKSRVMSEKDKQRTAVHEMGHALVAISSEHVDPLHRVTIVPRGAALGITMTRPLEDQYHLTEPQLKDRIAVALGGRTAEEIYFDGVISTGALNDLETATETAKAMVVRFGMSPLVGPLSFGRDAMRFPGDRPDISEETARLIDSEVSRLMKEGQERAREILVDKRGLLDKLSVVLMEREVLEGKEVIQFVEGTRPIPTREELKREAATKATNGKPATPALSGPEIIAAGAADRSDVGPPNRPDV